MQLSISIVTLAVAFAAFVLSAEAFRMKSVYSTSTIMKRASRPLSMMSSPGGTASQVTGAMPTANEYLEIIEPGKIHSQLLSKDVCVVGSNTHIYMYLTCSFGKLS